MRASPSALLIGGVLVALAADPAQPPLTDEEVVRLYAAGRPAQEILGEIERREPGFDLSPEMLEELRQVELPRIVIEAMLRRQREHDSETPRATEEPAGDPPTLRIRLNPDREQPSVRVAVGRRVDPQLAAEWELGNAPEDREFSDIALFLACTSPEHVPDHWRSKSPLGADFRTALPRHRMLAFLSGIPTADEVDARGSRVTLEVPSTLEVLLEPGVAHDLALGLALQVGGSYRVVAHDAWPAFVPAEAAEEPSAVVRGRDPRSLQVRFVRKNAAAADEAYD